MTEALRVILDEVAIAGQAAWRRNRQSAARRYNRQWHLPIILPSKLAAQALEHPDDPAATWEILRILCRVLRFNAGAKNWGFAGHAYAVRLEMVAAGEARLLFKQWATRRKLT